jgi:hypothetical protein
MNYSGPARSEAKLIAWAAARLVHRAREIAPDYAARPVQVGTHVVSRLLSGAGCFLAHQPLAPATEAMVMPPVDGVNIIVVNSATDRMTADFRVRHELAHVLAGEVEEPTFLDEESAEWSERVADLFALADLVPGREIARARRGRRPWREVAQVVSDFARYFGGEWEPGRLEDRVRLRLVLYRTQGI